MWIWSLQPRQGPNLGAVPGGEDICAVSVHQQDSHLCGSCFIRFPRANAHEQCHPMSHNGEAKMFTALLRGCLQFSLSFLFPSTSSASYSFRYSVYIAVLICSVTDGWETKDGTQLMLTDTFLMVHFQISIICPIVDLSYPDFTFLWIYNKSSEVVPQTQFKLTLDCAANMTSLVKYGGVAAARWNIPPHLRGDLARLIAQSCSSRGRSG